MQFHVSEKGLGEDKIIVLEDTTTGTKAEIYAFGALLNLFSVKQNGADKNIIYGFQNVSDAKNNITPLFQSAKLSPFVCRLKNGEYTFADDKHKIEKFYNHREAIHGLIYDAVFTLKEAAATDDCSFVKLSFDYIKTDPGFPFFYNITITYQLRKDNRLTITTTVTNNGAVAMPVADGWHPYFSFGESVNNLRLFLNTKAIGQFDNRLLPTGNFTPYTNFTQPRLIEETLFDHCFVLNENKAEPACILWCNQSNLQLKIYAEKNYPYLQVFIPKSRTAIAVENLSSLPDSFNNKVGLLILQPSQTEEFIASYRIQN